MACVIFIPGFSPCGGYWVLFCLHHVSYLRLGDELGVCLSYYCLSGTCVLVVVQYTGVYLVHCTYHIPQYHYIIVTFLYLVYCIIVVCVEFKKKSLRRKKRCETKNFPLRRKMLRAKNRVLLRCARATTHNHTQPRGGCCCANRPFFTQMLRPRDSATTAE